MPRIPKNKALAAEAFREADNDEGKLLALSGFFADSSEAYKQGYQCMYTLYGAELLDWGKVTRAHGILFNQQKAPSSIADFVFEFVLAAFATHGRVEYPRQFIDANKPAKKKPVVYARPGVRDQNYRVWSARKS